MDEERTVFLNEYDLREYEEREGCKVQNPKIGPSKKYDVTVKDGMTVPVEGEKAIDLSMKTLAEVDVREAEWFVNGYIPKNQVTTFGGDGGSGKTTFWCAIVAAVSSGRPTPFEESSSEHDFIDDPQQVLFFSSEDAVEEILKPKILKHGGNMDNIKFIDLLDERFSDIKFGSEFLEQLIEYHKPTLVVFDPIQSFIDERVQMNSRNAMRQCLNPLIGLCGNYNTTIIIIAHANKSSGTWGRKRLADSADLWDISRAVFLLGTLNKGLHYISQEKSNYGCIKKTLLFSLDDGKVTCKGFTDKHDKDFVTEGQYMTRQAPAKEEAKEFILETLQEHGGMIENSELMEVLGVMGISASAMKKAKAELKKEQKITLKIEGKPGGDRKNYISLTDL